MTLSTRKCAGSFWVLAVCFLCILALGSSSVARPAQPRKILVLPFHVIQGKEEKELQSFGLHADKRIRAAIDLMKETYLAVNEKTTAELLKDHPALTTDERIRGLAQHADADLVVYGFLSNKDSRYQMRGVMWDVRTRRVSVETDLKVDYIHGLPGALQVFIRSIVKRLHGTPRLPFYRAEPTGPHGFARSTRLPTLVDLPRRLGPWRSQDIQGALAGLDVGDMDGDKKNETVFLERNQVTISRFEGGTLRTLTQFSESPALYVNAEAEDLDGDGIAELLLTYTTPTGLESSIIRYVNRNFRVAAKIPNMILRTIAEPSNPKKKILVGQRTDLGEMFNGEVVRYDFDGAKIIPLGKIRLPPGTLLLSYVSGRLGKSPEVLRIILNQDQRLMVFDQENRLVARVTDKLYGLDRRIWIPHKGVRRDIVLPGRLLIADTDGDGENELLLIKHRGGSSVIQGLSWDGSRLREKWKTVRSEGIISDFRIRDFKSEGIRSLVLILVKPDPFLFLGGRRSVVFAYDLIP